MHPILSWGFNNSINNDIPDNNYVGANSSFRPDVANVGDLAKACLKPVIFLFYTEPDLSFAYIDTKQN